MTNPDFQIRHVNGGRSALGGYDSEDECVLCFFRFVMVSVSAGASRALRAQGSDGSEPKISCSWVREVRGCWRIPTKILPFSTAMCMLSALLLHLPAAEWLRVRTWHWDCSSLIQFFASDRRFASAQEVCAGLLHDRCANSSWLLVGIQKTQCRSTGIDFSSPEHQTQGWGAITCVPAWAFFLLWARV